MAKSDKPHKEADVAGHSIVKPRCGIVMPISDHGECTQKHWSDVLDILIDALESAGFVGDLVSHADEVTVIHKTIIQNLYENPVVICDVSTKNPNVMFELGIRLAFDKPCIVVKDDKTTFTFDTSVIEHIPYPRDLRYADIVNFKKDLGQKVKATLEKSQSDSSYSPFLKHFGRFTVAKVETTEVSREDYFIQELQEMKRALNSRSLRELELEKNLTDLERELNQVRKFRPKPIATHLSDAFRLKIVEAIKRIPENQRTVDNVVENLRSTTTFSSVNLELLKDVVHKLLLAE